MLAIKYKTQCYQFKPTWLGIVLTLVCIALFIKLGLWQYNKAQLKIELQLAQSVDKNRPFDFPLHILNVADENNAQWKYKHVRAIGKYEVRYQILLDNQVVASQAGFHVVTPLKINGSDEYVLVNRGWVPGKSMHADIPIVETPNGVVSVEGMIWMPSQRYFTLDNTQDKSAFETLWQYLDMQQYQNKVPIKISALMIKLDQDVKNAGGFVRDWEVPQSRIVTHLGYAYQWFGFAVAAFLIFVVMSFVKVSSR